jgi:hypothetical protein
MMDADLRLKALLEIREELREMNRWLAHRTDEQFAQTKQPLGTFKQQIDAIWSELMQLDLRGCVEKLEAKD